MALSRSAWRDKRGRDEQDRNWGARIDASRQDTALDAMDLSERA